MTYKFLSHQTSLKASVCYLWNRDGIKVQGTNFDLLEEEVELWTSWSWLISEGERVAVRQLPQDARLQQSLVHPGSLKPDRRCSPLTDAAEIWSNIHRLQDGNCLKSNQQWATVLQLQRERHPEPEIHKTF